MTPVAPLSAGPIGPSRSSNPSSASADSLDLDAQAQEALARSRAGDPTTGEAMCRAILRQTPTHTAAHIYLGIILRESRQPQAALKAYEEFLALVPDHINTWIDRGLVNRQLLRFTEAHACYDHALALNPQAMSALNNRANLLMVEGKIDQAIAQYNRVIELLSPLIPRTGPFTFAPGHYQLPPVAPVNQSAPPLAPQPFTHENMAAVYFQKALALLQKGDNQAGLTHYEYRWQHAQIKNTPQLIHISRWDGKSALHERHLLVMGEQGLGDVLQFLRFLPTLKQHHPRLRQITLAVHAPLVPLLKQQDWLTALCQDVVALTEDASIQADLSCRLLSLPYLLGQFDDHQYRHSLPLFATPTHPSLAHKNDAGPIRKRIGVMWGGNRSGDYLSNRSMQLTDLAPLFDWGKKHQVAFFSLLKEPSRTELDTLTQTQWAIDSHQSLTDFAATASLIAGMDIVVTVDTAVAHLALLMRKPTWVLLWHGADWRWRCINERSIWYPHAHLIQQTKVGQWDAVIAQLGLEIQQYLASTPPPTLDHLLTEGRALQHQKEWQKSVPLFEEILDYQAQHMSALHSLGLSLCYSDSQLQRAEEGLALLRYVIQQAPHWHDARFNLAVVLQDRQETDAACAVYRQLIQRQPTHLGAYINLGTIAQETSDQATMIECGRQLIARAPSSPGGYALMRQALLTREPAVAARYARILCTLEPQDPGHQNGLALALKENLEWEEAQRVLIQALRQRPSDSPALNTQGQLALFAQDFEKGLACFNAAAAQATPATPAAIMAQYRYNSSFALLGLRRYREAWPLFEQRWLIPREEKVRDDLPGIHWCGDIALPPKANVLLHGEQGLGDQLQFFRFVRTFIERYPSVNLWLEVHPVLRQLLAQQEWVEARAITVLSRHIDLITVREPQHFFKCPLLSLPQALHLTQEADISLANQPKAWPYLQALPPSVEAWRNRLHQHWPTTATPPTRRIGIFWSGTQQTAIRGLRSIPFNILSPLIAHFPQIQWVVLQEKVSENERAQLARLPQVFQHDLADFIDTAALIHLVDEVFSIDSVVAHLAGAMARPLRVLLPSHADWRWQGASPAHTPWYPQAQLYWQSTRGDWVPVIAQLKNQLEHELAQA